MSKQSKAKRDKRKKQQPQRPFARLGGQQQVQNHAVLVNEENQVVAAIGLQGREWLLSIGGQTMGNAESPLPMLAMLKHLSNVQEREGRKVTLEYSQPLQQMLDSVAAEQGKSADDYLAELVAEFDAAQAESDAQNASEGDAAGDAEANTDAATDASTEAEEEADGDADADTTAPAGKDGDDSAKA